ncbi:MAG: tellurite resistance TerB family protein [Vicinamibacterales bacterium]
MATAKRTRPSRTASSRLTLDEALIALFLAAMNANDHVAVDEAARAHHLIWSTRRFRDRAGEMVGRLIERMRRLVEASDPPAVIKRAARSIPARLRPSAFAVVVDLLLADGTLERRERRFLQQLGAELKLAPDMVDRIMKVVALKNAL